MIVNYTVYNKTTGAIVRTGTCPLSMMDIQVSTPDEAVIQGKADDQCDLVFVSTKAIMREFITTRSVLEEERKAKLIADAPIRAREVLIRDKMREIAIAELVKEGKIKS